MYKTGVALTPPNPQLLPFQVPARPAYTDFFRMFDVPFRFGGPWSPADDENRADVVVITRKLNDKVFEGANNVGTMLNIGNDDYLVVGVMVRWQPLANLHACTAAK